MKAAQYEQYGGPKVIEVRDKVPTPIPHKEQVLVEVHAASINPIDFKVRLGYLKDTVPLSLPITIGSNFSGVVVDIGEDVIGFQKGDEVYGQAIVLNGGSGAIAEYVASNAANTAHKPKKMSHIEAASLPLVGVSALQAIEDHIKLQYGQKILIHGGSGGIGSMAIQLAKSKGAHVTTTVHPNKKEYVKDLGADEIVDYKTQEFKDILFDAVFDTIGGEHVDNTLKAIRKGGTYVSMVGQPNKAVAEKLGIGTIGQVTDANTFNLTRLAEYVDKGIIKPQIDKVFPLDQTREAFIYQETGHPCGKVVIRMKQ